MEITIDITDELFCDKECPFFRDDSRTMIDLYWCTCFNEEIKENKEMKVFNKCYTCSKGLGEEE